MTHISSNEKEDKRKHTNHNLLSWREGLLLYKNDVGLSLNHLGRRKRYMITLLTNTRLGKFGILALDQIKSGSKAIRLSKEEIGDGEDNNDVETSGLHKAAEGEGRREGGRVHG